MGDLANDTAVTARGDGLFEATLRQDWEIWGPMGGYVAACALRAAGAMTPELRPAAFSCHYLSVAQFGTVDIQVSTRKRGRTVAAQRIEISQEGRPILDAMAWSAGDVEGLEHDETTAPDVPGPEELPSVSELIPKTNNRRSPSGTTSTRNRSSSKRNGRRTVRGRRNGKPGCASCRLPPSTIRGSTHPGA